MERIETSGKNACHPDATTSKGNGETKEGYLPSTEQVRSIVIPVWSLSRDGR